MWPQTYLQRGPLTLLLKLLTTEKDFFFLHQRLFNRVLNFNRTLYPALQDKNWNAKFDSTLQSQHSTRSSDAFCARWNKLFFFYFFSRLTPCFHSMLINPKARTLSLGIKIAKYEKGGGASAYTKTVEWFCCIVEATKCTTLGNVTGENLTVFCLKLAHRSPLKVRTPSRHFCSSSA